MNTTAKTLQGYSLATRLLSWITIANTTYQWVISISLLCVLFTALATVIITSQVRYHYRTLQTYQQQRADAELQHGRLLLERGTLLTHAHIANVAENRIRMVSPSQKLLVVV